MSNVLAWRTSVLENFFGVSPREEQHKLLTESLKEQKGGNITIIRDHLDSDNDDAAWFNRTCRYFAIGTGGINNPFPLIKAKPRNYETRLYNQIPFRTVPVTADLSVQDQSKYRLKCRETISGVDYFTYYLKLITVSGDKLNLEKSNGEPYSPSYNDSEPIAPTSSIEDGLQVKASLDLDLWLEDLDCKEYLMITNSNSIEGAYISEFGLVMGGDVSGDATAIINPELMTKMVMSPIYLDQESNAYRLTYKAVS